MLGRAIPSALHDFVLQTIPSSPDMFSASSIRSTRKASVESIASCTKLAFASRNFSFLDKELDYCGCSTAAET